MFIIKVKFFFESIKNKKIIFLEYFYCFHTKDNILIQRWFGTKSIIALPTFKFSYQLPLLNTQLVTNIC